MFENYIILSADSVTGELPTSFPRTRSDYNYGSANIPLSSPVNYHISVERGIDERQARELARKNQEIIDILPSIPLQLIQPLNRTVDQQQSYAWGIQKTGADHSPFTGIGVKVAVLDTGISRAHPCFQDEHLHIQEKDFTGEGNGDIEGHGTHCAGTIFGRDLDNIRIGVARGISEVLIGKVIGKQGGDSAGIVDAINWAVKEHADIISMSLGIDFPGLVENLVSQKMQVKPATSIALEAYRKNILLFERLASTVRCQAQPALIIAAAGNESRYPDYGIATSPPAISEGILSVGALGIKENKLYVAPFSNSGPVLSAPGVNILSANSNGSLIFMSGTSMATPHVAGIAALWAEFLIKRRLFSIDNLEAKLRAHSRFDELQHEDPTRYGSGMVQAP